MSGGVDSSVAVMLLNRSGFSPYGIHFIMHGNDSEALSAVKSALRLGIDLNVSDVRQTFESTVMRYFTDSYLNGLTPNPCVFCNRNVKFKQLFDYADKSGIDKAATGHYAVIEKSGGKYFLKKSPNTAKDQSYVLYSLKHEWLSRLIFPLGELTKDDVRSFAEEAGLENAHKSESQDICFIPDGDYAGFIKSFTGISPQEGDFVSTDGTVIGHHDGMINYTIGQRRGLKTGFGERLYVISKNARTNTVELGKDCELYKTRLEVSSLNILIDEKLPESLKAKVKVRYRMSEQPATVFFTDEDHAVIEFDEPQRAFTPGQSAVFYNDDIVLGGGIII